jgi:hypothetical protein
VAAVLDQGPEVGVMAQLPQFAEQLPPEPAGVPVAVGVPDDSDRGGRSGDLGDERPHGGRGHTRLVAEQDDDAVAAAVDSIQRGHDRRAAGVRMR